MKQPGILLSIFVTAALLAAGQSAWGQEQMTWSGLQAALESSSTDAEHPTLITLNNDVVASGEVSYLELPAYKHVILDLNGHAIDRRLTEAKDNGGFVLKGNDGCTLTIRDSGTGGNILVGCSTDTDCISLVSGGRKIYVLGAVGDTIGFYKYTGGMLPAGKAYYIQ